MTVNAGPTRLHHQRQDFLDVGGRHERLQEMDVRHPAADLPVMHAPSQA
jgi:hypothetical protein